MDPSNQCKIHPTRRKKKHFVRFDEGIITSIQEQAIMHTSMRKKPEGSCCPAFCITWSIEQKILSLKAVKVCLPRTNNSWVYPKKKGGKEKKKWEVPLVNRIFDGSYTRYIIETRYWNIFSLASAHHWIPWDPFEHYGKSPQIEQLLGIAQVCVREGPQSWPAKHYIRIMISIIDMKERGNAYNFNSGLKISITESGERILKVPLPTLHKTN